MTDSDAVRTAPLESPARRRARSSVAAEAAQLTADEVDRAEMRSLLVEQATVVDPDAWAGPPGASTPMSCELSTKRSHWSSASESPRPKGSAGDLASRDVMSPGRVFLLG